MVRSASRASERGLDWFTFFVADIQTGFGPFLAIYLTTQKWNQADIGLVLAAGSIAGLVSQLPGGWLVDVAPSKRRAAMLAVIGIGVSALLIAMLPSFVGILGAKLLHVASSAVLGPAIAAITLGLVGHAAVGPRLGRNARFSSVGNGLAAGVMGACGYFISPQAVFFVTAVLAIPTVLVLALIREDEIDPIRADGGLNGAQPGDAGSSVATLLPASPGWAPLRPPSARMGSISSSRISASTSTVGMASTAVTKKTACGEMKYPHAPITPAARPLPTELKRALRPNRGPTAAWPTRPRVMAAMAGPSTALDATCSSLAPRMPTNDGSMAISRALTPMPITASMAALLLEGATSTSQPPGSWLTSPAMLPAASTSPMSAWFHFCVVR